MIRRWHQVEPACGHSIRWSSLSPQELPSTESLKDTVARFLPYWTETIAPAILAGRRVLITAHGNSLRALVKYLDRISDDDIVEILKTGGVDIARRTVAKYREAMNIPSSVQRRREKRALAKAAGF